MLPLMKMPSFGLRMLDDDDVHCPGPVDAGYLFDDFVKQL